MINDQSDLFEAPLFPGDPEKTRIAGLLNTFILINLGLGLLAMGIGVPYFFPAKIAASSLSVYTLLICSWSWYLMRSGRLEAASTVFVINANLFAVADTWLNGGIESKMLVVFAVPIVLSTLLLKPLWAMVSTLFTLAAFTLFGYLGWEGVLFTKWSPGVPLGVWFMSSLILWLLYLAVRLSVMGWKQAFEKTQHDMEERRRAEVEKEGLKEKLFQAQKMESLGRMTGVVAQDFNDLLGVVTDKIERVKEHHVGERDIRTNLTQVEQVLQSAWKLNKNLLDFSEKRELTLERLRLDDLVAEKKPLMVQLLGKRSQLETLLGASGVWVLGDRSGLAQVLHNLVINAKEAMDRGGLLTLRTRAAVVKTHPTEKKVGEYLQLSVRDGGCGMGQEVQDKIFEPYFTTKDKGTGLGLATVFGIVKQHGGFIEVESKVGQGTEFRIFLPRA